MKAPKLVAEVTAAITLAACGGGAPTNRPDLLPPEEVGMPMTLDENGHASIADSTKPPASIRNAIENCLHGTGNTDLPPDASCRLAQLFGYSDAVCAAGGADIAVAEQNRKEEEAKRLETRIAPFQCDQN